MTAYRTPARWVVAAMVLPVGLALPAAAQPPPSSAGAATNASGTTQSVDGRIVFWSDDCQIYTINPDGSSLVRVTHFKHGCAARPSWSPDSARIVFERYTSDFDRSSIYSINADGSDLRLMVTDGAGFYDHNPAYTPDGKRIVYGRCRPDRPGGCAIYSVRADGTDSRHVTTYRPEGGDWFPRVSPDGRWLAFSRLNWKGIQAQIWLMPMDRSAPAHPITPVRLKALYPRWTPDSDRLYFQGDGRLGYGFKVFRTPVIGSHATQLTFTPWPNSDFLATSSPTGRYVAFASDRRYPDACCSELYLMHADGSHQHLVTGDLLAESPDWGTAPLQHGPTKPVPAPTAAELARFHRVQALEATSTRLRSIGGTAFLPGATATPTVR